MIAIDQEFLHQPEIGIYGDCMRACIASILDLPIDSVPHFYTITQTIRQSLLGG